MVLLNVGDIVLGMSLLEGGYFIYGVYVNFLGKMYNVVQYGLNEEIGEIDYDQVEVLVFEYKLKMIIGGFFVYLGIVDW